ncbi:MAG: putative lipoprotein [Thermodesulfobacteriota bacterium]
MNGKIAGLVLALTSWCVVAAGCSFYYSSRSISDSVSASGESVSKSSESSSPSSGSEHAAALYREDVRDFTAAYARGEGDVEGFQRGLAAVARRHGISDWEAAPATWLGVGEGLRRGAPSAQRASALGDALAGDDAERRREIQRGYDGQA